MAQLRRAVKDGHLYILAGQSKGTWQVSEKGEKWLRQNHYSIPNENEYVDIDAGTYNYLKDKGYLYIHGIEYDHNDKGVDSEAEQELTRFIKGLPMLLRLKERQKSTWELYLELSELNEAAWEELRSYQTDLITATNAYPLSRRQIFYGDGLLRVNPFPHLYQIFSSNNDNSKRRLQQAPETPGLNDNWQGNIFLERATQVGTWQRRVPYTTISFSGELLWLAKPECELDWPGQATKVGNTQVGWQLWRLIVRESAPTSWESIQNWFKYRLIDAVPQRQRLEIVSLPSAVREDGQYTFEPGKSIWIACHPPNRQTQGMFREIALTAEQIASTMSNSNSPSKCVSASYPADRVNYLRWFADQAGEYRICIQGDATAEPLRVKVASLPIIQPVWLRGLTLTVTTGEEQQTFDSFQNISDPGLEEYLIDNLTYEEQSKISLAYEPEGLPISITWNYISSDGELQPGSVCLVQSAEELTRCWKEKIFPAFPPDVGAKIVLNAGSFGCITLTIALPLYQQDEATLYINERLIAQFFWLSRVIGGKYDHKALPTPMPGQLRERLLALSTQAKVASPVRTALELLVSVNLFPAWVLFRLKILIAEIENMEQDSPRMR